MLRIVESSDGRGRSVFPLVGAVHFHNQNLEQAISRFSTPLREFVDGCRALPSRDEVAGLHRITQMSLRSGASAAQIRPARPGRPSGSEVVQLPDLIEGGSFVRQRMSANHNDPAESFINLIPLGNDQPVLLVRRDDDPVITICSGQPGREDFWILREKRDAAPDGDHGRKQHLVE